MINRIVALFLLSTIGTTGLTQKWVKPYDQAIGFARRDMWAEAREKFLECAKIRADDTDRPSTLGSGVTDRRPWRDGAPYSPNFGMAYSSFKLAAEAADAPTRKARLKDAIGGFEALVAKGQTSAETLIFLAACQAAADDLKASQTTQEKLAALDRAKAFKIDATILEIDDARTMIASGTDVTSGGVGSIPIPAAGNPFGFVPVLDFKYGLVIGNSKGTRHTFAHADADYVKDSLVKNAGYGEANVKVLKDATVAAIIATANTIADVLPENGVVFIFFSGAGERGADGKDYFIGADGERITKEAFYAPFVKKGATVFAFLQIDRPKNADGSVFGSERLLVGKVAQCHGSAPGELCGSGTFEGANHGLYAGAIAETLNKMRSNRIAILDFAWAVFDKTRKGADGNMGGQTPTLPVFTNIGGSAKF